MMRTCSLILFALLLTSPTAFAAVDTINNNFTMIDPGNNVFAGANDVHFTWDGTLKTAVAVSGQVSNATLSSSCPFFGVPWTAHDVAIYGPGAYTVYTDCPAGSPGCNTGTPINFTVKTGELGIHILLDWNGSFDMDVVNVMKPNAASSNMWTGDCGSNSACTIWAWTSYDFDGDGINGAPIVDGLFAGNNANFNLINVTVDLCCDAAVRCDDYDVCTTDSCDPATGACIHTAIICDDNNACTTDTCDPATGCQYSAPLICPIGVCDPATGRCPSACANCDDGNACTLDACDPVTGACIHTPIVCNDNNPCTLDTCDPAIGCVFTASGCFAPVYTINNNFTMLDAAGIAAGGANDVTFTWDGTLKTSVAASGQVSNATIGPFFTNTQAICTAGTGTRWNAHDVAVYGPGVYTVYSGCPAGSPGCGTGVPIAFTVGADEFGVHMLFDWGAVSTNKNIDVVNVWKKNAVFGPSPLYAGACGSNPADKAWELMSKDPWTGINGYPMVDGGLAGYHANFNMMGAAVNRVVDTFNNNFTMNQPDGIAFGGTNDIRFTWDGTRKTSVAASGQVSNATISSSCPFFGQPWWAHDVAIYGPGTYTVFSGCAAGSPGCGTGVSYTFTVNPGELGGHMLFLWNGNDNIDVVDIWKPGSYGQGIDLNTCLPALTPAYTGSSPMWTGACGAGVDTTVWDHMSYDWNNDCVNGADMVDGPFTGFNANFNLMGAPPDPCFDAATRCNDNNACTTDSCNPATGACVNTQIVCDDGNACTSDSCGPATGCIHTAIICDDNNACTADSCDPATGCVHTAIICDDNNACTADSCDPVTGCVHTPISCDDNDLCTADSCDPATGCIHTAIICDDNNACTTDSCDPATGCVHTPISCDDNDLCTTDSCDPATGCIHTAIICDDNNACTTDSCDPATGCVHTQIVCDDNNVCTTDSCDPATGCVYTPIPNCAICPAGSVMSITILGGGQNPNTVDQQIQTSFTVQNNSGCIVSYTKSSVTATGGTILVYDVNKGIGPQPSKCTWNGAAVACGATHQITVPATSGTAGSLYLDNKTNGGKDTDRMTVSAQ